MRAAISARAIDTCHVQSGNVRYAWLIIMDLVVIVVELCVSLVAEEKIQNVKSDQNYRVLGS